MLDWPLVDDYALSCGVNWQQRLPPKEAEKNGNAGALLSSTFQNIDHFSVCCVSPCLQFRYLEV